MLIKIKVKPGSKKEEVIKENGSYVICLKERAEGGKANRRLINLLAREFGVGYKAVKIKNPKSRNKIVEVESEI